MTRHAPASPFSRFMTRLLALCLPMVAGLFIGWTGLEAVFVWPVSLYFAGGAGLGLVLCGLFTRWLENLLLTRHYGIDSVETHHHLPEAGEDDPVSKAAEDALDAAFRKETGRD